MRHALRTVAAFLVMMISTNARADEHSDFSPDF